MIKMAKSVIVKSQVKELAKIDGKSLSVAEEFYNALEEKNQQLVAEACKRAKLNSRNTIMARDL
jgi:histone H3/H4